jgi:hypothetical protein
MADNYIPRPRAEFSAWFDNLVRQVGLHTSGANPDWNHIPTEAKDKFMESHGRWQIADQEAEDTPTSAKKRERNRVRKAVETNDIRPFVKQYMHFDPVTDEQRNESGIPTQKKPGKGGTVSDPEDHVEYEFIIDPIGRRIIIRFRILGKTRWGKGRYHCVEIRFWILPLDAPAPINADAPGWQSDADTASPWEITCDGKDSGKRIWVAMRWENASTGTKNQKRGKGPWSEIKSVIIP